MGRFNNGVIGESNGKVGSIVVSKWRGRRYIRAKGPSERTNNSPAQLEQQAKFKMAVRFTRNLKKLFSLTYSVYKTLETDRNKAFSQIVKEAITGIYPAYSFDYSKIKMSVGGLKKPFGGTATIDGGTLTTTWISGRDGGEPLDRAIIVAYCPFFEHYVYTITAVRRDNRSVFDVSLFEGQTIHAYLAFISEDSKEISDSVYTGQFEVE